MKKSILALMFIFASSSTFAAGFSCRSDNEFPNITVGGVSGPATLVNVEFAMNEKISTPYKLTQAKVAADGSLSFDVHSIWGYDRAYFIVPAGTDLTSAKFTAKISVTLYDPNKPEVTDVECVAHPN